MKTPNILSTIRLLLTPSLLYTALNQYKILFLTIFIIGSLTDALDGYMARRFNEQTEKGKKLDSIADYTFFSIALISLIILNPLIIKNHYTILTIVLILAGSQAISKFLLVKSLKTKHYLTAKISSGFLFITIIINTINYNKLTINIYLTLLIIAIIEGYLPIIKDNKNKPSYFITTK